MKRIKISLLFFGIFYLPTCACHSQANLPKGNMVSVCESPCNQNKICQGNFLFSPLVIRKKLRDFPLPKTLNCFVIASELIGVYLVFTLTSSALDLTKLATSIST